MRLKRVSYVLMLALINACTPPAPPEELEIQPTVAIKTQPLAYKAMTQTLTVYGSVTPLTTHITPLSVPFASQVTRIHVSIGQRLAAQQPLLTLQPSEEVMLAGQQARQELAAAVQEVQLVTQRLNLKLATQHELVAAQTRKAQATALVADFTQRAALQPHTLTAASAGIVTALHVQQGQRLAAALPLVAYLPYTQLHVSVGIEPDALTQVHLQQKVVLHTSDPNAPPLNGTITQINASADTLSHLIPLLIKPYNPRAFLLNETVQADIVLNHKTCLVAPRAAVLPDEGGYSVFSVQAGKAVKHSVTLGLQTDTEVEIVAPELTAATPLVVLGNYELADGMAVEVQP